DDRGIAVARRAVHAEHVLERRLYLIFVEPGPRVTHRLDVPVAADLARAAMSRQLRSRAAQSQLVEDRPRILDAHGRCEDPRARGAQIADQPRDPAVERAT